MKLIPTCALTLALMASPDGIYAQTLETQAPIYTAPAANAVWESPGTTIAVRYGKPIAGDAALDQQFDVRGARNRRIAGRTILAPDQQTLIFKPARALTPGEAVTVNIAGNLPLADGVVTAGSQYSFTVSSTPWPAKIQTPASSLPKIDPSIKGPYLTAPATLPVMTITNPLSESIDSYMGLATFFTLHPYLLILDGRGELVYYQRMPDGRQYADLRVQPNGLLSYFAGVGTNWGGVGEFKVMDSSYKVIDTWKAGNGLDTDNHEFIMLPNGNVVLMAYDLQNKDMTAYGGKPNATFIDVVLQELDADRNVVFQWRASDYIPFTDTFEKLDGDIVDPYHGNSIEVLPDGNWLVSWRNLSEITKIDRNSGRILWRMGGQSNEFKLNNGSLFSYQHDARWLPNGHMTVFDNGNQHTPPASRAVEYAVDEANRTLTQVWESRVSQDLYNFFMGNTSRMADGSTLIGWGGPRTLATAVNSNGQEIWSMELPQPDGYVYRWHPLDWQGKPATQPALVLADDSLHYSWNGATDVVAWRVDAGSTALSLSPVLTITKNTFETVTPLDGDLAQACYYRVSPLDATGAALSISATVKRSGC